MTNTSVAPCVAHPGPIPQLLSTHFTPLWKFFLYPDCAISPYSSCPYNIVVVFAFELYKNIIEVLCVLLLFLCIISQITHIYQYICFLLLYYIIFTVYISLWSVQYQNPAFYYGSF